MKRNIVLLIVRLLLIPLIDTSAGRQKCKQLLQRALQSGFYGRRKAETVLGALFILGTFNDAVSPAYVKERLSCY
jgi:hypothetical protein